MSIDTQRTVAEIALERPQAAVVFEKLGIDYCCGGCKPLATACEEAGIDVNHVEGLLNGAAKDQPVHHLSVDHDGRLMQSGPAAIIGRFSDGGHTTQQQLHDLGATLVDKPQLELLEREPFCFKRMKQIQTPLQLTDGDLIQ